MDSFIQIPYGQEDVIINTSQVVTIKSNGKSITVKLATGDNLTFQTTLEKFTESLKPLKIDAERKTRYVKVSIG